MSDRDYRHRDVVALLQHWRSRLEPAGGIWLLTPKRGQPGYVDQRDLIAAGLAAELVDNKVCSVSDTTSAMRFVIRKRDRPTARGQAAPCAFDILPVTRPLVK